MTPEFLRKLAEQPATKMWEGSVRQALHWAANTLEAAQAVIDERKQSDSGARR